VGEGDVIVQEARFAPPTGKTIDAPFVLVAEVRDGAIVAACHYYDRLLALEQEGVVTVEKLFAELAV
jgi:ketosteroid isomerase-like protein